MVKCGGRLRKRRPRWRNEALSRQRRRHNAVEEESNNQDFGVMPVHQAQVFNVDIIILLSLAFYFYKVYNNAKNVSGDLDDVSMLDAPAEAPSPSSQSPPSAPKVAESQNSSDTIQNMGGPAEASGPSGQVPALAAGEECNDGDDPNESAEPSLSVEGVPDGVTRETEDTATSSLNIQQEPREEEPINESDDENLDMMSVDSYKIPEGQVDNNPVQPEDDNAENVPGDLDDVIMVDAPAEAPSPSSQVPVVAESQNSSETIHNRGGPAEASGPSGQVPALAAGEEYNDGDDSNESAETRVKGVPDGVTRETEDTATSSLKIQQEPSEEEPINESDDENLDMMSVDSNKIPEGQVDNNPLQPEDGNAENVPGDLDDVIMVDAPAEAPSPSSTLDDTESQNSSDTIQNMGGPAEASGPSGQVPALAAGEEYNDGDDSYNSARDDTEDGGVPDGVASEADDAATS